ncbi:MAG: hypothetical protein Q8936_19595 [Bacillota bacterium]|nr:hypothetical protein [Bacillota bacterium]
MQVEERGKYYFIKNSYFNKLQHDLPVVYILDSNVVIDIYRLFSTNLKSDEKNNIKDVILQLNKKKIDCSYAITELSCDYQNGGVNKEKADRIANAVKEIFKKSDKQLSKYIESDHQNTYYIENEKKEFGQMSKVIINTLELLFRSYVPIAGLFYAIKNITRDNRINVFQEYLDYLNQNVKGITIYELVIAVFYLFNSDKEFNSIQGLIKVQNKMEIINKIWNVSWDLAFLRYIDDNSRVILENKETIKENYILVTKDKALAETAKILDINEIEKGKDIIPSMVISNKKIKTKYLNDFYNVYSNIASAEKIETRMQFFRSLDENGQREHYSKLTDDITNKLRDC